MTERRVIPVRNKKLPEPPALIAASLTRVAVYARVSTDFESQHHSLLAQKDYYEKMIAKRPEWTLAGIYADDGISGTSSRHRRAFQQMLSDCESGQVDMIITKSLSRFARNTLDSLVAIRRLKLLGIGVYFEKEKLWTLEKQGEFLLTLMSSLAQEESRSISENCAWGQRKRFADGRYSMAYTRFLGYEAGPNGRPIVNPEEAVVVKQFYALYLRGLSAHTIAKRFTECGLATPSKSEHGWSPFTVRSILANEKYKGDALLQKHFVVDFLTKKRKRNEGELPMYYVTGGHEAIIAPDVFDYVQFEIARRLRYSGGMEMAGRIYCSQCGGHYGVRYWHIINKVWQCHRHVKKGHPCSNNSYVYDEMLRSLLNTVLCRMLLEHMDLCRELLTVLGMKSEKIRKRIKEMLETGKGTEWGSYDAAAVLVKRIEVYPDDRISFIMINGQVYTCALNNRHLRMPT